MVRKILSILLISSSFEAATTIAECSKNELRLKCDDRYKIKRINAQKSTYLGYFQHKSPILTQQIIRAIISK